MDIVITLLRYLAVPSYRYCVFFRPQPGGGTAFLAYSFSASSSLPPFPVRPPQMPLPREPTPLPTQIVSLAFRRLCSHLDPLTNTTDCRANATDQVALAELADSVSDSTCHVTYCVAYSLSHTSQSLAGSPATSRESASHAVADASDSGSYALAGA